MADQHVSDDEGVSCSGVSSSLASSPYSTLSDLSTSNDYKYKVSESPC